MPLGHRGRRFPPVVRFLERFRALLGEHVAFSFDAEVAKLSRIEQAVAFLALLELRKANEIVLEQAEPLAPIRVVRRRQETHVEEKRGDQWTAHSA